VTATERQINRDIAELGQQIQSAWEEKSLDWWFTCLLSLTITLPGVLGFRKTLFVIDNVDFAAQTIVPSGQFLASEPVPFGEHVKHMLTQGDYIFACEDLEALYSMMVPIDEGGVDLMKNTDFMATYGIAKQATKNDPPLFLELKGEAQPFVFKPAYCDGIPNYLLLWHDLNGLVDQAERQAQNPEEKEDAMYFAVAHAQALIDLVFVPTRESAVKVVAVRRASKTEEQRLRDEEALRVEQMRSELTSSRSARTVSDG
jgi:uncharacterized DUF497 family protein